MSWDLFGWLRRKASEAVVAGVADGLKAVAPPDAEPAPPDLADLRALLAASLQPQKALAAAKEDEPEPAGGKPKAGGRSR